MGLEKHPDSTMSPELSDTAVVVGNRAIRDNPKPEVGLSDMPTKLIRQIVTEFESVDRKKALLSLLLTSRRFHTFVEDYIFADLSLIQDKDNKHNDDGAYRRTRQLVHRLTTKPELCQRVESVKTDSWEVFATHSQIRNRIDQDHSPATQLLALLSEIESLSLHFLYGGPSWRDAHDSLDFSLSLPDVVILSYSTVKFHGFSSLTTLALSFDSYQQWRPLNGSVFILPCERLSWTSRSLRRTIVSSARLILPLS